MGDRPALRYGVEALFVIATLAAAAVGASAAAPRSTRLRGL
jgi:hypothetical protein